MKTCLLLFVGTIALVTAVVDDPCDHIAADNELNEDKNPDQQVIKQAEFYRVPKTTYFTNRASEYKGITEKNPYCTAVSHEEGKCGAVRYDRWFAHDYTKRTEGFVGILLKTIWWSVNTQTKSLIRYSMDVIGKNKDDYIFEMVPETLAAKEYKMVNSVAVNEDVQVSDDVAEIIGSKFALNRADLEEGWGVYATCDGKRIWSSISEGGLKGDVPAIENKIHGYIEKLKTTIKEKIGFKEPIVVHGVTTDIPEPYSELLLAAKAA